MSTDAGTTAAVLFTAIQLLGCSGTAPGPASAAETSAARSALADRIRFLESYVTFRRGYESLDYDIMYQNNGGGLIPGPSDWDIRLIAVVPRAEIDAWIPDGVERIDGLAPGWLKDLPGETDRSGIAEWYVVGGMTIGVDRDRSVVAYRNTSNPDAAAR